MSMVRLCKYCGHHEAHHGPISGRREGVGSIPGRLCFYGENTLYADNLCACSGFDVQPQYSFMDVIRLKLGGLPNEQTELRSR